MTQSSADWIVRYRNKTYLRIPGGEAQFGHLSGSVVVWFRRKRYIVKEALGHAR